jgi:hypothetical protein
MPNIKVFSNLAWVLPEGELIANVFHTGLGVLSMVRFVVEIDVFTVEPRVLPWRSLMMLRRPLRADHEQ